MQGLRPYRGADDLQKMQQLIARLASQSGFYPLHPGDVPHRIYNGLRRYDPTEVVFAYETDSGEVTALVICMPDEPYFEVHTLNPALESQLFDFAEQQTLAIVGKYNLEAEYILQDGWEGFSERGSFLESRGYTAHGPVMAVATRDLSLPLPEASLAQGFVIRSAEGLHEADKLAQVHAGAFDSQWTTEEYARLMSSPGYDPARERVVVTSEGEFAAFCIIWFDDLNKTMLFEPVGTHEAFQQRGLARALMVDAMHVGINVGMRYAQIAYELDYAAAVRLYTSALGFTPRLTIIDYQKPIIPSED